MGRVVSVQHKVILAPSEAAARSGTRAPLLSRRAATSCEEHFLLDMVYAVSEHIWWIVSLGGPRQRNITWSSTSTSVRKTHDKDADLLLTGGSGPTRRHKCGYFRLKFSEGGLGGFNLSSALQCTLFYHMR